MTKPPSPRPLSVKVIAVGYGLLGVILPCYLAVAWFFWQPLFAPATSIILGISWAILYLTLAFGIWQLSNFARWVAIGLQSWVLITVVISMMYPAYWDTLRVKFEGASPEILIALIVAFSAVFLRKVAWSVLVIFFLITRKSAFGKRKG